MKKIFIPGNHQIEEFKKGLEIFEKDTKINSVMILGAAGTDYPEENYNPILRKSSLSIVGGVFTEILNNSQRFQEGTLLIGFWQKLDTLIIRDEMSMDIGIVLNDTFEDVEPEDQTIFIFADVFSSSKTKVIDGLYNAYGTSPNYIGGGAGSLDFISFPCLFTNQGMIKDGIVIGVSPMKTSIGVAHGFEVISKALKVTESDGNKIISLDWNPASEVYTEIIENHAKQKLDLSNPFDMMKSYPFGISKLDAEMVVRDPFKIEGGCIFTLDNIEQGSHVHIMHGHLEGLLEGASSAHKKATKRKNFRQKELFIIDCISRVLFMEDDFPQEIAKLDVDQRGFGALTLGEIANNGESYLEIFNKTAVVCHIDDSE